MHTLRLSLAGAVVLALLGGLGSAFGVAAQEEVDTLQLVTDVVEPGVERIISDGAGHDLDETHPTYRYDMDGIAIAPDGTVWLSTTHHDTDNPGASLWVLGKPGTYRRPAGLYKLVTLADGTLLGLTDVGIRQFDGERWVPDEGPRLRSTADGGLLLLLEGADLIDLSEGQVTDAPELYTAWDRSVWVDLWELGRTAVSTSGHWCWLDEGEDGNGVLCAPPMYPWVGEPTTYLAGTPIHQLAAAPDGSVWAVGEYDGGPGGLYRITLPEASAE